MLSEAPDLYGSQGLLPGAGEPVYYRDAEMSSGGQTLDPSRRLAPPGKASAWSDASDAVLVGRARSGDREAFAILYLRHHEAVASVCRRRLGDPHLAEDATQETFLRAWKALPNFTHDADLSHWLRRIARNHCHDLWRAGARERLASSSIAVADEADPAAQDAMESVPDRVAVQALLARLRPRDAELLVDHHAAGITVRALAERWRMTKGAMEVALHRARQRARRSANDEKLRGVLPVLAARRLWAAVRQVPPAVREAGTPAAIAAAQVAIVVVTAGAMPAGPAQPLRTAASTRPVGSAVSEIQPSAPDGARWAHSSSRPSAAAAARGDQRPAVRRPRAERDQRSSLVAFTPVRVGDREVRSAPGPDWEVEREYRVHDPATGRSVRLETHKGRYPATEPLHERACPAAESGRPLVSCTDADR
jgi:RNA polymerase sigma-70 factor, ECF subfamily